MGAAVGENAPIITGAAETVGTVADTLLGTGGSEASTTNINKATSSDTLSSLTEQLQDLIQSSSSATGSQTTVQGVSRLDEQLSSNVQSLIEDLTGRVEGNLDFEGVRDAAIQQVLESGIGSVIESGTNQGAFDSTVQGTAAEKLASRAATEGANAEATLKLQEQGTVTSTIAQLVNVLKGAEESIRGTTQSQEDTTNRQERDTQRNTDNFTQVRQVEDTQATTESETRNNGLIDQLGLRGNVSADNIDRTELAPIVRSDAEVADISARIEDEDEADVANAADVLTRLLGLDSPAA